MLVILNRLKGRRILLQSIQKFLRLRWADVDNLWALGPRYLSTVLHPRFFRITSLPGRVRSEERLSIGPPSRPNGSLNHFTTSFRSWYSTRLRFVTSTAAVRLGRCLAFNLCARLFHHLRVPHTGKEADHGKFPTVATARRTTLSTGNLRWSRTDVGGRFSLNRPQNSTDFTLTPYICR